MARFVKVNTLDELIHVRDSVWVHRHLLCDISDEMRSLVESHEESESTNLGDVAGSLFSSDWQLSDRRGLAMWTGFLYGQRMWTFGEADNINEEFRALADMEFFAHQVHHWDAADAAIDAIRDILHGYSNNLDDPFAKIPNLFGGGASEDSIRVLIDFMVHEECAGKAKGWTFLLVPSEPRTKNVMTALCEKFFERAERERAGEAPLDLMERCRYHEHTHPDERCYLDK